MQGFAEEATNSISICEIKPLSITSFFTIKKN